MVVLRGCSASVACQKIGGVLNIARRHHNDTLLPSQPQKTQQTQKQQQMFVSADGGDGDPVDPTDGSETKVLPEGKPLPHKEKM